MNEKGVLHVPMALLAALMALTGFAIWGLLHHWNGLTRTQLRLDRCTREKALELQSNLNGIASANRHMKELRVAEAAALAALQPEIADSLRVLVETESIHQQAIRAEWTMKQANWALHSGCGSRGDMSSPLPSLGWERDPPDALGPQPLTEDQFPKSYRIEAKHHPRASASEVYLGDVSDETSWHSHWVAPQGLLGAGTH